jgi:hypothetical protein
MENRDASTCTRERSAPKSSSLRAQEVEAAMADVGCFYGHEKMPILAAMVEVLWRAIEQKM